jgi:WD40 repeat protein
MAPRPLDHRDFLVSHRSEDDAWAEWVAWQLTEAGYTIYLDSWELNAGQNFMLFMESWLASVERVLALLTPRYAEGNYTVPEWTAAAARDPRGEQGFLVPIMVEQCEAPPLQAPLVRIDLVGLAEPEARRRLLDGLRPAERPDRAPFFPDTKTRAPFPGHAPQRSPRRWTILHLPSLAASPDRADDLATLPTDVEEIEAREGTVIEAIAVSGNVSGRGIASDFAIAGRVIDRLVTELGVGRDRLVIVPGSRDVNEREARNYFEECDEGGTEPVPPYVPKWRPFVELVRRATGQATAFGPDEPWSYVEAPDLRLAVAGLNSTFLHRDQKGVADLGPEQRAWFEEKLASHRDPDWLRLGVVHEQPSGFVLNDCDLLLDGAATDKAVYRLVAVDNGDVRIVSRVRIDGVWQDAGPPQRLTIRAAVKPVVDEQSRRDSDEPVWSADDGLAARVVEAARLRYGGADVTQVQGGYLRVALREAGVVTQFPVAAEPRLDAAALERFETVVARYRADQQGVRAQLVYGGEPASHELRRRAEQLGVELLTLPEFQGIIDLRDYVRRQTADLNADIAYRPSLYVSQRFRPISPPPRDGDQLNGAFDTMLEWLRDPRGGFLLVLGEFGTGKTFLLRELARRLPDLVPFVSPMLLSLRQLNKASQSAYELVAQHLAMYEEEVHRADVKTVRYMVRQGQIALLFDGFDELANRVSYARAAEHLDTLIDAAEGQAKIVVSSRSQHFVNEDDVATRLSSRLGRLSVHRIIELQRFERAQIRSFLVRRFDGDEGRAERRLRVLADVRDLLGLSENPRFLSFIADLDDDELEAARSGEGEITAARLYEILLERWIVGEYDRANLPGGQRTLSVAERWRAVELIAVRLWVQTEAVVHLADLAKDVGEALGQLADMQADEAQHVIGSGTLLVRPEAESFTFVHQSVMEWLVARQIARELAVGSSALAGRGKFTELMPEFLMGMTGREALLEWARGLTREGPGTGHGHANALRVLRYLGEGAVEAADLAGQDLAGANLRARVLRNAVLVGTDLTEADLTEADLTDADLSSARLVRARLDGAILRGASLANADLSGARLLGANLTALEGWEGARWDRAVLVGADLGGLPVPPGGIATGEPTLTMPDTTGASAVAFHPTGAILAVAHTSGNVTIWNAFTGRHVRTLEGHSVAVDAVAFSPDGTRLVSASEDATVRVWETETGRQIRVLDSAAAVRGVAFSPDGKVLASAGDDRAVRVWETATGRLSRVLDGHRDWAWGVAFSPDGTMLASTSDDATVRLWDAGTGRQLRVLEGHTSSVWGVAFSPDGGVLASAGADHNVRLWEPTTGRHVRTLEGHTGLVWSVRFSPDPAVLASADDDGTVRVWDATTGRPTRVLEGHTGLVRGVAFSPDGTVLASAGADRTVRLWDAASGRHVRTLEGRTNSVRGVAFSSDARVLASAGADGTVRVWDAATGHHALTLDGHTNAVQAVAFGANAAVLASAGDDGTVRVWDATAGGQLRVLKGHTNSVWGVAFSPDGRVLASAGADRTVRLWEVGSGRPVEVIEGHTDWVWAVAFSPDGGTLASAGADGMVRVWNATTGGRVRALDCETSVVRAVAYSPDGKVLASAGADRRVRLWDAMTGRPMRVLEGHRNSVWAVAFSPDGSAVASAGDDRVVRVWDAATGRPRRVLEGHGGLVWGLAFSPDGTVLASAGDDGTVRMWDWARGRRIGLAIGWHGGGATVGADGRYHIDGDATGQFWWAVGLARFEPGELDRWYAALHQVTDGSPVWDIGIAAGAHGA